MKSGEFAMGRIPHAMEQWSKQLDTVGLKCCCWVASREAYGKHVSLAGKGKIWAKRVRQVPLPGVEDEDVYISLKGLSWSPMIGKVRLMRIAREAPRLLPTADSFRGPEAVQHPTIVARSSTRLLPEPVLLAPAPVSKPHLLMRSLSMPNSAATLPAKITIFIRPVRRVI